MIMSHASIGTDPLAHTPDASVIEAEGSVDHDQPAALDPPPPPKRKGGRKPIYATSEERKQRNRQAQAAFRERRTEYIKQMEINMKETEDILDNMRREHREVTDQNHMLRFKASLLEELLDEHSIDFRSELQARSNRYLSGQPRSQLPSPVSRIDEPTERVQVKRRSANGTTLKADRPLKNAAFHAAAKHTLDSPQSSIASPSSFTFPNLSPDVGDFEHHHNGMGSMHRSGPAEYEYTSSRSRHPLGLGVNQHAAMDQSTYSSNGMSRQAQYEQHDGSYDYPQEPLRSSQNRLNATRLVREGFSKATLSANPPEHEQYPMEASDLRRSYDGHSHERTRVRNSLDTVASLPEFHRFHGLDHELNGGSTVQVDTLPSYGLGNDGWQAYRQ